jgi:hypothetical protein
MWSPPFPSRQPTAAQRRSLARWTQKDRPSLEVSPGAAEDPGTVLSRCAGVEGKARRSLRRRIPHSPRQR